MSREVGSESVHVWRVALDRDAGRLGEACALLAPSERERAARFRFDLDRDRWTMCRSALRRIIGSAVERDPSAVEFQTGPHGKPFLAGQSESLRLEFNVSHSEAYALIAVTRSGPVGVDLERIRPSMAVDLPGVFAPDEQALLDAAAPELKAHAFCRLWTRKEALLKAAGTGLAGGLNQSTLTGIDAVIFELTPADGYLGAVAVPMDVTELVFNATTIERMTAWKGAEGGALRDRCQG